LEVKNEKFCNPNLTPPLESTQVLNAMVLGAGLANLMPITGVASCSTQQYAKLH